MQFPRPDGDAQAWEQREKKTISMCTLVLRYRDQFFQSDGVGAWPPHLRGINRQPRNTDCDQDRELQLCTTSTLLQRESAHNQINKPIEDYDHENVAN